MEKQGVYDHSNTYQMEFGFDSDTEPIYDFQMRQFKQKTTPEEFKVEDPYKCRAVFGKTDENGLVFAVTDTDEPEVLSLLAQRAKEDGIKVAYLMKRPKIDPNIASYIDNLGLLILGRDLAVQAHGYFNSMVQADNVMLLQSKQLGELDLRTGDTIKYVSNGTQASITRIDRAGHVKDAIREVLNN